MTKSTFSSPLGENIFRTENGQLRLQSLFRECRRNTDKDLAVYTLYDEDVTIDGTEYKSLYKLYMACEDPTEYLFAMKHLAGWEHWERLSSAEWFQPYVTRWRKELELLLRARALKNLIFDAENGGKTAYDANKFLVNAGWKPKDLPAPGKRGRPSKEEVQKEAQAQADLERRLAEDSKRIGIN